MQATEQPTVLARLRPWLWGLVGVAIVSLAILLAVRSSTPDAPPEAIAGAPADLGSHFTLVDRENKPVTPETLKGTPYVVFFGFTRCPDVCPTTLSRMAHLRKAMGADGEKFRIVFVSVDSGHDRPADVGAYVDLFGTPILGLTGSEAQIEEATASFRVFYQKVPVEGGEYTVDHSAFVILMDREGRFRSLLSDHYSDEAAIDELRRLIA